MNHIIFGFFTHYFLVLLIVQYIIYYDLSHNARTVGLGHGAAQLQQASFIKRNAGLVTFLEREEQIRAKASKKKFVNILKSNIASILVFCFYLISVESVLSCLFTVGLTIFWYYYAIQNESELSGWSGSGLDWVVLGFCK